MCLNVKLPHLVANVSRYVQVPLTANHSLVKTAQNFQRVAKVSTGFGFSEQVTDCPTQHTLC